jgi:hypothetical protein
MKTISSSESKIILDKFYQNEITFPADQLDAIQGFFLKRGFTMESSRSLAIVFSNQALIDNMDVYKLLEMLDQVTDAQLSKIVLDVVNAYSDQTSVIGYTIPKTDDTYDSRNVLV